MSRSIKEDVKLLRDIKDALLSEFNPDSISTVEMEQFNQLVICLFENHNKWLLSDKISSEKQGRMDSYRQDKVSSAGMGSSPQGPIDNAPTAKQIAFAERLGVKIPSGISKSDLSVLIDVAKKSKAEKMGDGN